MKVEGSIAKLILILLEAAINLGFKIIEMEKDEPLNWKGFNHPPTDPKTTPLEAYHNFIQIYTTAFHLSQQASAMAQRQVTLHKRVHQLQVFLLLPSSQWRRPG